MAIEVRQTTGTTRWCRFLSLLVLALLCVCSATAKPADLKAYPHMKHLLPDGGPEQALGAFALDADLFDATRTDYANMRIVDDAGTEIPFLVRTRTEAVTTTRDKVIPTRVDSLHELPGNRVEIELSLTLTPDVSQALVLSTGVRDFEKLVTVHGSVDGQTWEAIATAVPIVDYSRFIDFRSTRIPFQPARYQRLRLSVSDVTLDRELPLKQTVREALHGETQREFVETSFRREDFRINAITLLGPQTRETGQHAVTTERAATDLTVRQDGAQTVIEFRARREPVSGIRIMTSSENFSRPVRVEGKAGVGEEDFEELFRGSCRYIAVGDVQQDSRTLNLARPARCSEWRVTIDNKDNPALELTGVVLEEPLHEALFLNTPPCSFRVYYGGKDDQKPHYDLATIVSTVGRTSVTEYRAGEAQENPAFRRTRWRLRVGGKAVLSIAILLMVLALGWGVAVAAKHVEV